MVYPLGTGDNGRILGDDGERSGLRRCGNIALAAAGLVLVALLLPLVVHPLLLLRLGCTNESPACNGVAWQDWTVAMLAALFPAVAIAVPWFSFRRLPASPPPSPGFGGGLDMLGFAKPLLWAFGVSLRAILAAGVMALAGSVVAALEPGQAVAPGWVGTMAALTLAAIAATWWALSRTLPLRLGAARGGTWANTGRLIVAIALSMAVLAPASLLPGDLVQRHHAGQRLLQRNDLAGALLRRGQTNRHL